MASQSSRDQMAEVLRRVAAGESEREIARALRVSRTKVWDIKQAAKKAGG